MAKAVGKMTTGAASMVLAGGLSAFLSGGYHVSAEQEAGKASISGRVLSDSGVVLVGATVKLRNVEQGAEVTLTTDQQGRFAFTDCRPGWYGVIASQPGYATLAYGATRVRGAGTPLVVNTETVLRDLTIRLPLGAVVSGVVRRPDGQPFGGITVSVLETTISAGGVRAPSVIASASTSRNGEFRIFDIPPGQYVLRATTSPAPISPDSEPAVREQRANPALSGYSVTYYPSALGTQDAVPLTVSSGEQRAGADIVLKVVPLARLEGQVIDPGGSLSAAGTVSLTQLESSGAASPVATVPVRSGAFVLPDVQAGTYLLRANESWSGAGGGLLASSVITVVPGEDMTALRLFLRPAATISGQAVFVGGGPPPSGMPFRLIVYSAEDALTRSSSAVAGTLRPDGSFVFSGVEAGKYRFRIQATTATAGHWALISAFVDQQEAIASSFEVGAGQVVEKVRLTFTNRLGQLSGTLLDRDRTPATGFTIVVFPEDKTFWSPYLGRLFAARPANTGEFRLEHVPPGAYRVATVRDPEPNAWLLPEFLETLVAGSVPVSVTDQAPATLHLVVGGPKP